MKVASNLVFKGKFPVFCQGKKKYENKEVIITVDQLKVQSGPSFQLWEIKGIDSQVQDGLSTVVVTAGEATLTIRPGSDIDYRILFAALTVATNPQFKPFFAVGMPVAVLACLGDIVFKDTTCLEYLIGLFTKDLSTSPLSGSGVHSPKSSKLNSPRVPSSPRTNTGSTILDSAPRHYISVFTCLSDLGTYGMASIHIVCSFDRVDMLKLLFSAGMNMNTQSSVERGKQTPLHYCLHDVEGSVQCFTYLVKELNMSTHIENAYGLSVLSIIDAQWPGTYYHSLLDLRNDVMSNKSSARGSICSADDN